MVARLGHMGDIVWGGLNGGGVGDRWDILNAISDWRDEDGGQRTQLVQGALYIAREMSLSREDPPHWFTAVDQKAREMPPWEVAEIHLDKARIHLYPDDWNPRESKRKKGEIAERARSLYQNGVEIRRQTFAKYVGSATKPELVRVTEPMGGDRVPEIFKLANQYGDTAERTPPYRPEVRPVEFLWARLKGEGGLVAVAVRPEIRSCRSQGVSRKVLRVCGRRGAVAGRKTLRPRAGWPSKRRTASSPSGRHGAAGRRRRPN